MDDIADLTFTLAPPINKPSINNSANRKGASSFDYLSASIARSSSASPSHHPISRTISPSTNSNHRPSPGLSSNNSQDAFSSIFGEKPSSSSQQKSTATSQMTIAERLQAAQNQNLHRQLSSASTNSAYPQSASFTPNSIHPGARSVSPLASHPTASLALQNHQPISRNSSESWDFDLLEQPKNPQHPSSSVAQPHSTHSQSTTKRKDSWGIDPLSDFDQTSDKPSHVTSHQNGSVPPDHMADSLLGDEFGPVEAPDRAFGSIALTDEPTSSGDDILGLLGAPIDQVHADRIKQQANELLHQSSQAGPSTRNVQQRPSKPSVGRADSPPPHILGQVVEIGFSPARSRQALIHTRNQKTGDWDVSSAVESLLGAQTQPASREENVLSSPPHSEPQRKPRGPPSQNHPAQENGQAKSELTTALAAVNAKEIQDQAAELLAQASAYGTTALGKAASFWKQGKASLTKVIEDQTGTSNVSASKDGDALKPKWMRDVQAQCQKGEDDNKRGPSLTPFSDDSSPRKLDQGPPVSSTSKENSSSSRKPYVSSARRQVAERIMRPKGAEEGQPVRKPSTGELLFSSDPRPTPSSNAPTSQSASSKPPPVQTTPRRNFPSWPAVTVSAQQVKQSEVYRVKGNELFKQGQYGSAEAAYTQALDVLQDPTSLASPQNVYFGSLSLFNNRAAARLKNGDGKGARSDVDRVIEVLFCEDSQLDKPLSELTERLEWNQSRLPVELKQSLNLPEQVGKALSKRARISEDAERWEEAKVDWENCRRLGGGVMKGAGGMKMVSESLGRCSQAVSKPSISPGSMASVSGSKPKLGGTGETTKRAAQRIGEQRASEAVQRLKIANEKIELEEAQKLDAKDAVDERIGAWKNGKENNLRALIASLDSVLWDQLNWKKVSMAELLTESQVKVKYVRAISKVHPDKIPKDATVAQQMIAKSVFAVLNEAWIAMQN
ncbi:hypothetical protein PGT21_018688 [Puccinia graminis f. sp. tritici]|uniref:UBA domain-containing protein n=1 Tax=Puccinia graminis f. sp. tritici TaxID=56615 RepID=A0A5B0N6M9_PUCGR|nr:hypothetical protein PGT21_018688 [Puccinia graminis f. sp. tritici]KAA1093369.1 hypothetical protein PGTUg99_026529 [Puccinia graminis f. sp. tritici]